MLEKLFNLLADAQKEQDINEKLVLFEEYASNLKNFLLQPKISEKYSKSDLEKLNVLHGEVLHEVESIFSSFKNDIKDFQKKHKGIKAYINMPRKIAITDSKKG